VSTPRDPDEITSQNGPVTNFGDSMENSTPFRGVRARPGLSGEALRPATARVTA
jgi:hypothetical protein